MKPIKLIIKTNSEKYPIFIGKNLINRFINSSSEIGLFSHPYKNSIEDEVALCLSKKKCNEND